MQLSSKARKSVATGLAISTFVWGVSLFALPAFVFAAPHGDGCLINSSGTIYLVTGGQKRGFPSAEVFMSHGYNFSQVVASNSEDTQATGPVMVYADGTLVKGPADPLVYLVANGQKRGFVSGSVFLGLGFSFANIVTAAVNTFADLPMGANLESATERHTTGVLVLSSGTVWQMTATGRIGISSMAVFNSYAWSFAKVVAANSADLAAANQGTLAARAVCSGGITPPPPPPASGLNVSLSGPAASTLIQGQATAALANFVFSGSGTVTAVTLKRTGVSADSTLSNVYLFDGSVRLTDAATVSSGNITFSNSSGLFISSGSKTITVRSDIAASTSGQTVGVQLTAVTLASGSVSGLPVSGNIHTIATADLATVSLGTALPSSATTTDPQNDVRVWENTFTVGVRDVTFSRMALRQINSIQTADINNFRLLVDGAQVAQVQNLDANGYVTFSGFSKVLASGGRNVKVLANVIGGSSRIIQMSMRNKADLDLVDSQYGVNIAASGTIPSTTETITVNSGSMTVVKASASASGNVTKDAPAVSLGKFTFTAFGEPIKVETLSVAVDMSGTDTDYTLRNGKIMVNGSQVGSTTGLVADGAAAQAASFTTNFTVNPGSPATVEVVADIFDEEATGAEIVNADTIQVTLLAGASNATRQVSLGTVNVPSSAVAANLLTVAIGSVTLAQQSNYGAQTVVVPQTAYKFAAFNLTGNSTEDVNVHTISVDFDNAGGGGTLSSADLTNVYLVYGSTTSTPKSSVTATGNSYSVSFLLAKNAVVPVEVYATIGSTVSNGATLTADVTVTGTTASSSTSVNTGEVIGQTITAGVGAFTTSKDASSPDSMLIDDSGTVVVAKFKVDVTNDSYTLTEVDINIVNASAVQNVILKDGTTTLGTKPGATSVLFSGLSVLVPANTNKVLTVELQMSTIGVGAGTTGSQVTATLDSIKHTASSTGVEATDTNDRVANAMYAYKAVPTITNVALPNSTLNTGTQVLAKFTVSSSGTGTVAWQKFAFTVTKNVGGTDTLATPQLWDSDSVTQISGTGIFTGAVNVNDDTAGGIEFIANSEQQISGAKTYELRVTIAGAPVAGDNITTQIAQPSSFAASVAAFSLNAASSVTYYDTDAGATVTATDVRQTAQDQYTTVDVTATATVVGHDAALSILQSYSTGTAGNGAMTLTLPEWTTDNVINGATFTMSGAGSTGVTCTPFTGVAGTGAVTTQVTTFNQIQSVVCSGTDFALRMHTVAVTNDSGVGTSEVGLVIVVTKAADYAIGSVVVATDSDASLAVTGGVAPAASFVWSDVSAAAHTALTLDWTNGYLVKNLPTNTQNLTK